MILPVHTSLLRVETIRLLLAEHHHDTASIAARFGVSRQAVYGTIKRFDLGLPLQPLDENLIAETAYLQVAMEPDIRRKLIEARIMERLLGAA